MGKFLLYIFDFFFIKSNIVLYLITVITQVLVFVMCFFWTYVYLFSLDFFFQTLILYLSELNQNYFVLLLQTIKDTVSFGFYFFLNLLKIALVYFVFSCIIKWKNSKIKESLLLQEEKFNKIQYEKSFFKIKLYTKYLSYKSNSSNNINDKKRRT